MPAGAGLSGSADAAAVLVRGMVTDADLGLEIEDLRRLGARIRADVPFCLSGGTGLGEGVGDARTPRSTGPLPPPRQAEPERGYGWYLPVPTTDAARRAKHPRSRLSRRSDPAALRRSPEPSATTSSPLPRIWYRRWRRTSARCCKPGRSGPGRPGTGTAVYGIFDAENATAECSLLAPFVSVCKPVGSGVLMV